MFSRKYTYLLGTREMVFVGSEVGPLWGLVLLSYKTKKYFNYCIWGMGWLKECELF